jgi:hypothetical protein
MAAYTSAAPACGEGLTDSIPILNARLSSSPFRIGEPGTYEVRFDSILSPGLQAKVRLFVDGSPQTYFEVASFTDFHDDGSLESLGFYLPGIELALGTNARIEFVLDGQVTGSPAGWWVDNVELVKLP